ncbi:hypothetical protein [Brachyspira sp. SAP_772]|uniref:hypothetical protein n=1 Tax=Brachyspira sp. SAP_772 TaxID=2608385 RepID=UPI0012F4E3E6|nr:hypothetical protein [Brachyspira sp. SAP_772]
MKNIIKLSIVLSIFLFSCTNRNSVENIAKYQGTYRASVNTTPASERQLIVNTATVKVDENSSINVLMEAGNAYDKNVDIAKEELTKVNDNSYSAQKDGNSYTFTFYNDYMNLNIHNTDNSITDGQLPKVQ